MKFDIQDNSTLRDCQQTTFVEVLLEIPARAKAAVLMQWQQYFLRYTIYSERRTLARLSDRELEDMGINRVDAIAEGRRNFSDVPDNRLD